MASICASFALKGIFHPFMSGGVTVPSGGYAQAFALEFIISFILMFVVTAVATDTRAVSIIFLFKNSSLLKYELKSEIEDIMIVKGLLKEIEKGEKKTIITLVGCSLVELK